MRVFYCPIIPRTDKDTFTQSIRAGTKLLTLKFQWASATEEQLEMIFNAYKNISRNDPLVLKDGNFNREYDYYTYYMSLADKNLSEWLSTSPELPSSLNNLPLFKQEEILSLRIKDVVTMSPVISQLLEILRWQCTVTDEEGNKTVTVVTPGGWYRNGDPSYSFRFMSNLENIGKEDISKTYIEIEVYE